MFAVVEVQGHQYIVEKGQKIVVDKIKADEGSEIEFHNVLLVNKDGKEAVECGTPFVKGATVKATVVDQGRGEKIRVFKMKPKKRYRKTYGHRSYETTLEITDIKA